MHIVHSASAHTRNSQAPRSSKLQVTRRPSCGTPPSLATATPRPFVTISGRRGTGALLPRWDCSWAAGWGCSARQSTRGRPGPSPAKQSTEGGGAATPPCCSYFLRKTRHRKMPRKTQTGHRPKSRHGRGTETWPRKGTETQARKTLPQGTSNALP
jgi:hypothetical protein